MIKFKTSFSNIQLKNKPTTKKEFFEINSSFTSQEIDFADFVDRILLGYSFAPSVFKDNKRSNANFISTQVFALDFDDNQNPAEKIALFKEYGITTNVLYYSFSHTEEHKKFRMCFILDTIITDKKVRDTIQEGLMLIGADSDKACKDVARMFFGTNKRKISIDSQINKFIDILPAIDSFINANVSEPTKRQNTQKLKNFQKTCTLIYTNKDAQKMKENEKIKIIEHYNFKGAMETSVVLKGFFEGTTHLKYRQLLVLATNFYYVKGGLKWMKDVMDKAGTYKQEDYDLLTVSKRYGYLPMDITDFDSSLIGEYKNLLTIDKNRQGVQILTPVEKIPVERVSHNFSVAMNRISNRDTLNTIFGDEMVKKINILKASVGSGKTKNIIRQKNVLIAVPNHRLKDELAERMKQEGLSFVTTPEAPVFNDTDLNDKYNFYQSIGDTFKANKLIKDKANEYSFASNIYDKQKAFYTPEQKEKFALQQEDSLIASEYLKKLNEAYNSDKTVITTHRRAILSHKSFNKSHIIFDEDIFQELMPIVQFKRSDLTDLLQQIKTAHLNKFKAGQLEADVKAIFNYLDTLPTAIIRETEKIVFNNESQFIETISQLKGGEKIIKFLSSDYILKHVSEDDIQRFYAVKKYEIDTDSQITIVSATADKWIYDKLFEKKDFNFADLGIAENLVPIVQYTQKAYSRNQMKLGQLPPIEKGSTVITYKPYKDLFDEADEVVHFGKTSGFDHLKGKNSIVAGTPISHPTIIALYAKSLGLDYSNQEKENRSIQLGNYRFDLFTYKDDNLSKLEIIMAQMELEQAVGRTRTSRTEAKTEVFSKIPINSSDIFKLKK